MTDAKGPHAGAFLIALLLAPLALALAGQAIMALGGPSLLAFFCINAPVVGLPPYLLAGGPLFWRTLRDVPDASPFQLAGVGLVANFLSLPIYLVGFGILSGESFEFGIAAAFVPALFCTVMGAIFAPVLGGLFGGIHILARRAIVEDAAAGGS